MSSAVASAEADEAALSRGQVRRMGWLHFCNDLTLDFITPLLPGSVGVAWIGIMEGAADAIGQVLRLFTGRASDRSGERAPWIRAGYQINALARPLAGLGMLLGWPAWIVACRIADRIGKGVRGSAADALIADWTSGDARARAFARMRTMDHLGATVGGLAAAFVAWWLPPERLWLAVCSLVAVALAVAVIARGLVDRPRPPPAADIPPPRWWPQAPGLGRALAAIGVASLAVRLAPLIVLVQVAGLPAEGASSSAWPLWQVCLGWAVLGLVQAAASGFAGTVAGRYGPTAMLRLGWIAGAAVFAALAFAQGPWLIVVGLAFGVLAGLTEGAEKAWIAGLAPSAQRATAFGAMALVTAAAGLIGNAACAGLLAWWGPQVFLVLAGLALAGTALTCRPAGPS